MSRIYYLKNDSDDVARANILVITSGLVISAIISLYYFGLFTKDILLTGAISAPIYVFATYIGTRFFNFLEINTSETLL